MSFNVGWDPAGESSPGLLQMLPESRSLSACSLLAYTQIGGGFRWRRVQSFPAGSTSGTECAHEDRVLTSCNFTLWFVSGWGFGLEDTLRSCFATTYSPAALSVCRDQECGQARMRTDRRLYWENVCRNALPRPRRDRLRCCKSLRPCR